MGITIPLDARVLKSRLDLITVAGRYTRLRPLLRGGWTGCCPLHKERHPSFFLSASGRGFKCFGCGAGGDLFDFIIAKEYCSFPESLRIAAELLGVARESPREARAVSSRRRGGTPLPPRSGGPAITRKEVARPCDKLDPEALACAMGLDLAADLPCERATLIYKTPNNCTFSTLRSHRPAQEGHRGRH